MVEGYVSTARAARSRLSPWATRVEYAAFAWALLFAAAHVYWAFGATVLPGQTPDLSAGVLFEFMAVILTSTREGVPRQVRSEARQDSLKTTKPRP